MFSLLTLIDDIATTLDDVAAMTKVAIKKTSALMSDDLAVNATVVDGVNPQRELPVVLSIFKGSLINKVYCISGVMFLTLVYAPILKMILLLGGAYLSYEGFHCVYDKLFELRNKKRSSQQEICEDEKIKGAIRTDLILSMEIIVIAKNSMKGPLMNQLLSLILIGLLASVLIYGLVAILVKIDDMGLYLIKKGNKTLGPGLVKAVPYMMKGLGILGTTAMFLVGGGIFAHIFHFNFLSSFELIQNLILGVFVGGISFALIKMAVLIKER